MKYEILGDESVDRDIKAEMLCGIANELAELNDTLIEILGVMGKEK